MANVAPDQTNLIGLLDCDWPIVCPIKVCLPPFTDAFSGLLFTREILGINPEDLAQASLQEKLNKIQK